MAKARVTAESFWEKPIPPPVATNPLEAGRLISLLVSDSLPRDLVFHGKRGNRVANMVRENQLGVFKDRELKGEPVNVQTHRDVFVHAGFGGWDPRRERGLNGQQGTILTRLIPLPERHLVREVFVVAGINSLRGVMSDEARLPFGGEEEKAAVLGVNLALDQLAEMFPQAQVYYLGAGQLPATAVGKECAALLEAVGKRVRRFGTTVLADMGRYLKQGLDREITVSDEVLSRIRRMKWAPARWFFDNQMPDSHFQDRVGHWKRHQGNRVMAERFSLLFGR